MMFCSLALIQPQMNVQMPQVRIPIKPLNTPPDSNCFTRTKMKQASVPNHVT